MQRRRVLLAGLSAALLPVLPALPPSGSAGAGMGAGAGAAARAAGGGLFLVDGWVLTGADLARLGTLPVPAVPLRPGGAAR